MSDDERDGREAVLAGLESLVARGPLGVLLAARRERALRREFAFLESLIALLQVDATALGRRLEEFEADRRIVDHAADVHARSTDPEVALLVLEAVRVALATNDPEATLRVHLLLDVFTGLTSLHLDALGALADLHRAMLERRDAAEDPHTVIAVSRDELTSAMSVDPSAVLLLIQGLTLRGLIFEITGSYGGGVFYEPTPPGDAILAYRRRAQRRLLNDPDVAM